MFVSTSWVPSWHPDRLFHDELDADDDYDDDDEGDDDEDDGNNNDVPNVLCGEDIDTVFGEMACHCEHLLTASFLFTQ